MAQHVKDNPGPCPRFTWTITPATLVVIDVNPPPPLQSHHIRSSNSPDAALKTMKRTGLRRKKNSTATPAGGEGRDVTTATTMAARVFELDELATRIADHLLSISRASVVALALTCRNLEVPALRALWAKQGSFSSLIQLVLPTGMLCHTFPDPEGDLCLLVSTLSLPSQHPAYSLIMKRNSHCSDRPPCGSSIASRDTPRGCVDSKFASGTSQRESLDSCFLPQMEPLPPYLSTYKS